ncbi:hypothetical protein C2L64_05760 [Paraburkholderia hospita]|uniref:Uncharacterized protein n=1 Tax=Paraburkholderia hospita TaxID=169430 RepID=A0AAN1MI30_9BURK|nr:hypothetical protein C2L64_05760 [Paraburkholderia hospita]
MGSASPARSSGARRKRAVVFVVVVVSLSTHLSAGRAFLTITGRAATLAHSLAYLLARSFVSVVFHFRR